MKYDPVSSSLNELRHSTQIGRTSRGTVLRGIAYLMVVSICAFFPATQAFGGDDKGGGGGNPSAPTTVQFGASKFRALESDGSATISVTRTGVTTGTVSVNYNVGLDDDATATATQRTDFVLTAGTLTFAPGETAKSFTVLINKVRVPVPTIKEAKLLLSNVRGTGAALGNPSRVSFEIENNDVRHDENEAENPVDDHGNFVRQQYHDFLTREPDDIGLANWRQTLQQCPNGGYGELEHPECDRVHISAAFYQSTEFQERGYFVYRFFQAGLGRRPQYKEFVPDMQRVGGAQSPEQETISKAAYIDDFAQRADFKAIYDGLTNGQFVDKLEQTAGVHLSNKAQLTSALDNRQQTRAQVLRAVVESKEVFAKYFNQAFVAMQYFGYLRRDPDETGFRNWVETLDTSGNSRHMIFGFIYSAEYRSRFGKP